ncbi:unnamed protein product [Rhodiola kirilowii]
MDFITHLPSSKGFTAIMVVVDRMSKYAHFTSLKPGFTAESIAALFVRDIARLHGLPSSIISDRDPLFMSRFWREFFTLQQTNLATGSAYHPQTDGQTEIVNRALEDYLRCFVRENQADWETYLHWAEYSYNTAWHSSAGMTPFEAVYGRHPPNIIDHLPGTASSDKVENALLKRDKLLTSLRANLLRARNRIMQRADLHRTEHNYEVGDWAYIRLQPYRQSTVRNQKTTKLARRFYGPFLITAKIGPVAYRLQLPDYARIHDVFHVSLLRKCVDPSTAWTKDLPSDFMHGQPIAKPETILGHRRVKKGTSWEDQLLVQWTDQLAADATWEPVAILLREYPDLDLEGKVSFDKGGNVTGFVAKRPGLSTN